MMVLEQLPLDQLRNISMEKAFEMGWKPDMSYRNWTDKKVAISGDQVQLE